MEKYIWSPIGGIPGNLHEHYSQIINEQQKMVGWQFGQLVMMKQCVDLLPYQKRWVIIIYMNSWIDVFLYVHKGI